VKNKEVLHRVMDERDMVNAIKRKAKWVGHISRRTTSKTRYLRKESGGGETKKKV
jgi:hypothetical protein